MSTLESMERKIEKFSGRRRPEYKESLELRQAVASRQNSIITIALNSEGRRHRRLPIEEGNMASHKKLRELMVICYADNMLSDEGFLVLW